MLGLAFFASLRANFFASFASWRLGVSFLCARNKIIVALPPPDDTEGVAFHLEWRPGWVGHPNISRDARLTGGLPVGQARPDYFATDPQEFQVVHGLPHDHHVMRREEPRRSFPEHPAGDERHPPNQRRVMSAMAS